MKEQIIAILEKLIELNQRLLAYYQKKHIMEEKYLWDTPTNARHSLRVICDEERLTVEQKNTMCATVQCESGFNTKAINYNKIGGKVVSTDYGIAQINDHYHIGDGKDFPSSDYVLNNPEACIRWMCKLWKSGNTNLWECYKQGLFKKYL